MIVVAQRKREEEEGGRLSQQCRNTFTKRFSCNDVLRLLSGEVFPTMLAKFVKLLWGPFSIVIYSSQVVQGSSFRQNDIEDSDRCGKPVTVATEQNVAKMKCLIKEDREA